MEKSEFAYVLAESYGEYDEYGETVHTVLIGPRGILLGDLRVEWIKSTFVNSNKDDRGRVRKKTRMVPDKNMPFEKWLETKGLRRLEFKVFVDGLET